MPQYEISIGASAVLLQLNGKVICEHSVPSDPIMPPCKFSHNDRTQTSNGKINRGSMRLLRSHQRHGVGGWGGGKTIDVAVATRSSFIYLFFYGKRWQRVPPAVWEQPLWRRNCVHRGRPEVYCVNMHNRYTLKKRPECEVWLLVSVSGACFQC